MARRGELTSENLIALGVEKLAKLVIDEAGRNASFKKLCAAALAGAQGPTAVAAVVDRRLAGLERARGLVDWEKRKTFAADLRALLTTITDELGTSDPEAAADRLVRLLVCADSVFERVDDSSGAIQGIFHDGATALPRLAGGMPENVRMGLAERLVPLLAADAYGLIEVAMHGTIPLLTPVSLEETDARLAKAVTACGPPKSDVRRDWQRLGLHDRLVRARQGIADAKGDVDAFIALSRERPDGRGGVIAVAERLLAAGRPVEALAWVRRSIPRGVRATTMADIADGTAGIDPGNDERVRLEIRILTTLGRKVEAQDLRWRTFEGTLDAETLRDYVVHLGDFEEFDALDRAFSHAAAHADRHRALDFFLKWPRLDLASRLILTSRDTWAGEHYGLLLPAAEALEPEHAAAATVLYRVLLDDILARARSTAYGHAARYLVKLEELATADLAEAGLIDHDTYRTGLRRSHGRKTGFWSVVESRAGRHRTPGARRTLN